jgi:hypothetical protein
MTTATVDVEFETSIAGKNPNRYMNHGKLSALE